MIFNNPEAQAANETMQKRGGRLAGHSGLGGTYTADGVTVRGGVRRGEGTTLTEALADLLQKMEPKNA